MNAVSLEPGWVDVAAPGDIPKLGARVVTIGTARIALFRTADDGIFAMQDRCPHKGGPLSQGIVHGTLVTCPLHGWTIELGSGEAMAPDRGCVPTIPVRVVEGRILLRVA